MIVDIQVEALDRTYQYRVPKELEQEISTGTPVRIPFGRGNRLMHGFVIGLTETPAFDVSRIKDILGIEKKHISVEGQLLQIAVFLREQYGCTMNEALKTVLPVRKKIKSVEEHWLTFKVTVQEAADLLHEYERKHYKAKARLLNGMLAEGGVLTKRMADAKYKVKKPVIDSLVKDGIIAVTRERKYYMVLQEAEKRRFISIF